ncbi:MAG: ATP-binding protein [Candidatus Hatepunaea meridiana]|nr:ATP-binding protein [Candidatus Hatepunaea meridiana]
MLLEFSVENFLSFKEKTTFSMLPHSSYKEHLEGNVTNTGGNRIPHVLNSAVVFGANASGKTNLIKSIDFVRAKLLSSDSSDINEKFFKFGFSKICKDKPTSFSVVFLTNNIIFDYSFSIHYGKIVFEKLLRLENESKKHWKPLFERSESLAEGIQYFNAFQGPKQTIFEKTRPEILFLKSLYEWNNKTIRDAYLWFKHGLMTITDPNEIEGIGLYGTLQDLIEDDDTSQRIQKLVRNADFGIEEIKVNAKNVEFSDDTKMPKGFIASSNLPGIFIDGKSSQIWDANFKHAGIDDNGDEVFMSLDHKHESLGTRKLFALSGPIIDILQNGITICIDELTCSMHPVLTKAIIDMFHDPKINKNGAQLIFNTHDIYFLNKKIFRRDQIWFTEKNKNGATELIGLHDYKVRNDEALGVNYLLGAYGAIPIINHEDLFTPESISNDE